jgi:ATP-dependent DNA helicase RecQ
MVASSDLVSALHRHFSFPKFRPGQRQAVKNILEGLDTLVVMPTGHGKSLIYQLAALLLPNTTLVISPLVSLMKDQVDKMIENDIQATYINSTLSGAEQDRRLCSLLEGDHKILLVAPERLRNQKFHQMLSNVPLSLLVVDEAHCLSQWGHDFRPDYLHIVDIRQQFESTVTLALTATATRKVQDEISKLLDLPDMARIITGFNRPNLSFEVFYVPDVTAKLNALSRFITENGGSGIIYTGTRRDAEEVAEFIKEVHSLPVSCYHAGLDDGDRSRAQDLFMAGDLNLVAATNAFGMGIDRSDLRFVLHYTMPGSLEAYYQEAGRAGRDMLPARGVLFYSPQDRALHEFFIDSASPTVDELRSVHAHLTSLCASETEKASQMCNLSLDELSSATNLPEVKARVALEQLETINAVSEISYGMGKLIRLRLGKLSDAMLQEIGAQVKSRSRHKRSMLSKMVRYAETNDCRRRIILDYFGDSAPAKAPNCCDNCMSKNELEHKGWQPAQTHSERAALIVLETIAQLQWGLGKGKIARILSGSSARSIAHFTRHCNYGKLAALRIKEIEFLIVHLIRGGFIKAVGSKKPTLALTPKGKLALKRRAAIPLESFPLESLSERPDTGQRQKAKREDGETVSQTGKLLAKGLSPTQIAAERGLTESTIYSHLAQLIADGKIHVDDVVPANQQRLIRSAIDAVGSVEYLAPIKAQLPEEIDYPMIRCVTAAWKFEQSNLVVQRTDSLTSAVQLNVVNDELFERLRAWRLEKARAMKKPAFVVFSDQALQGIASTLPKTREELLMIHGIGPVKAEKYGTEVLSIVRKAQKSIPDEETTSDPVTSFLSRPHPRRLQGPWLAGWALDFHSRFVGSDQVRGVIGDMVYRYKYQGEHQLAGELACFWAQLLAEHPELPSFQTVIPIPPSRKRDFDPVAHLAEALASQLGIQAQFNKLIKIRPTRPQKELKSIMAKHSNVTGAFTLQGKVAGQNLLLVDDLYDSGATLREAARTLAGGRPANIVVLTLTKTIHADQ